MDLVRYQQLVELAERDPTAAKLLRKYKDANLAYLKAQDDYTEAQLKVDNYLGVTDDEEPDQAS